MQLQGLLTRSLTSLLAVLLEKEFIRQIKWR